MSKKREKLFVILLVGMALTSAGLVLSIPPLFRPHEPYQVWMTGILAAFSLTFAAGTLYLRHTNGRASHS